jgi:transposase
VHFRVASVFVQATKSKRKDKTYVSYLVREAFRTPQGPRSRTVCNITGLPDSVRELVAAALSGKDCLLLESIELSDSLSFGGLAVLRDAWERFGLDEVFATIEDDRQRCLLKAMIFSRVLFPCAKLALAEQARGTLLAAACGLDQQTEDFDEDDLYEAMDALNGQWVGFEKKLFNRAFTQSVSLVLYDLTSVYFEGDGPKKLSAYGHSRDHRNDRPQVILAVAADQDGVPIHLEVLRGNRADTTTLQGLLTTLGRRFGIKEAVFVFDGGMSSTVNLQELESQQLRFVTRLSSSTLSSLTKELPEDQQPELWDRTKLMEFSVDGKRYVVAGGEWRRQRDAERRNVRIAKAEAELARMASVRRKNVNAQKLASQAGRALQRLKAHKYFDYEVDTNGKLQWKQKEEIIAQESEQDGLYLLHTNLPVEQCNATGVLAHYKNLLDIEEAFCQLKSYMEVRPVFHYRPDRVRNHMRICFLAYWLTARLGREWRAMGERGEVPRLLRALQVVRVGTLRVKGIDTKRLLTTIPDDLNTLLKNLDLLRLFAAPPRWVTT